MEHQTVTSELIVRSQGQEIEKFTKTATNPLFSLTSGLTTTIVTLVRYFSEVACPSSILRELGLVDESIGIA